MNTSLNMNVLLKMDKKTKEQKPKEPIWIPK